MYRLILYYLVGLLAVAVALCLFHILPYNPLSLIISTLFLLIICAVSNFIFSRVFDAPTNLESVYISALILALIISPIASYQDIMLFIWAGLLTVASKYILAIKMKHVFNPVAIAVVLTSIGFNGSASWWVGTATLTPFVLIGGLLIVRKIKKEDLVLNFLVTSLAISLLFTFFSGGSLIKAAYGVVFNSSLMFLAFAMLTEPLTTPPSNRMQIGYGVLVGFLSVPQIHFMGMYLTPELALCIGNIFTYLVSPKYKLILSLKDKKQYGTDTFDFHFSLLQKIAFSPGQYMEWTLPNTRADSRGNRRYLTIASSPTEDDLHLGVKFYPKGSSFKQELSSLETNGIIVGGQLAGDFTLPTNHEEKCVFISGGIGITPFRSMIKYLIDTKDKRSIVLFYANRVASEITYSEIFEQARNELGIKTVYTLTDQSSVPSGWPGKIGRIDAQMIEQEVPDYRERKYYISGPHTMVTGYQKTLKDMGIADRQIKVDFFPGFA